MVFIYKPDNTPLLGYVTHSGLHIDNYTVSTDGNGNTTYYYFNSDGVAVYLLIEPTLVGLNVGDDSRRTVELMGDDILTLRFSMPESLSIPLRSWCMFEGKRYYLYKSPEITKQHNRNFEYVMPMFTSDYMLKITMMRNRTYNRSTGVYGGDLRLKFPLTATPREHLEMIAACLNDAETETNAVWDVDYSKTLGMKEPESGQTGSHTNYDGTTWDDGGDNILVSYEFNSCIDAMRSAAMACNTEYEISEAVVTSNNVTTVYHLLSLHNVEYNKDKPLYMSYGKGNGFKSGIARKNESDLPPVDLLYIQGGEQNIPTHYGMKATQSGDTVVYTEESPNYLKSNTLLLPKNVACLIFKGHFFFVKNPSIGTDADGNRIVLDRNVMVPGSSQIIHEFLYDENGDEYEMELPVPTPCYLTSADGRCVERVRHTFYDPYYSPRGTKVESFYDASEVYPMRIGGVSKVQIVMATRQVEDGSGGTTTETYRLYDIIDALDDCPDYSQCSIEGETMSVVFQDGMLAGREFDLNTTENGVVICEHGTYYLPDSTPISGYRMELCPSDQDNITMPNETFAPKRGDHYIVFHCSLPEEYISGIAYGAEYRALREMARHLYDHGKETFTFNGSVDTMWAKRVWNEYVERYADSHIRHSEYFAIGQHIRVTDVQLFGSNGLTMRVTGLTQPVNSPRSIELTLSNAIVLKYDWVKQLAQTVVSVRSRPRFDRPDNPVFPRYGRFAQNTMHDVMVDAQGNLVDLRRNAFTPIELFGSVVGLNANSGLRGEIATARGSSNSLNERLASMAGKDKVDLIIDSINRLSNLIDGKKINVCTDSVCAEETIDFPYVQPYNWSQATQQA